MEKSTDAISDLVKTRPPYERETRYIIKGDRVR